MKGQNLLDNIFTEKIVKVFDDYFFRVQFEKEMQNFYENAKNANFIEQANFKQKMNSKQRVYLKFSFTVDCADSEEIKTYEWFKDKYFVKFWFKEENIILRSENQSFKEGSFIIEFEMNVQIHFEKPNYFILQICKD